MTTRFQNKAAIVATVFLLLSAVAGFAQTNEEKTATANKLFGEAYELFQRSEGTSDRAALEKFREAIRLYEETGSKSEEAGLSLLASGSISDNLGEKSEALKFYDKALIFFRANDFKEWEAVTFNNIGAVYSVLGEKQKSLEYYLQALPLLRQGENKLQEANTLNNIGKTYLDLKEKEKALEYFNQSLPLSREVNDKAGEAVTLNNIGTVFSDAGEKQKALDYFNRALLLHRRRDNKSGEASTLLNIGAVYSALGENRKALDYYDQSLNLFRRTSDKSGEASVLSNFMFAWNNLQNKKFAVFYGKQSVSLFQQIRSNIKGLDKSVQQSYTKSVERTYRKLAEILIADGRLGEAQQILNLFKDQQFYDFNRNPLQPIKQLVKTPRETVFTSRYETLSDRLGQAGKSLDELQRKIGTGQPTDREIAQKQKLESELKIAGDEFLAVLKQFEFEFSKPGDAKDRVATVPDTIEMQTTLRNLNRQTGQKTVAVYTLIGTDNFSALIVSPDSIKAVSSPVKGADLNDLALRYWKLLQSDKYEPTILSKQIYDAVFKPIESELPKETTTIMWSLDDKLRYIPPAALYDGKQYLVERYSHVVFTRTDGERMTRDVHPNWTGTGFGSSEMQTVELLGDKIKFEALPGVSAELQKIFKQSDSKNGILGGEVLMDAKFTKTDFLESLKNPRPIVHIASHFAFRPGDESRSFLLLGDGSSLTLGEMKKQINLFQGVDLLTLSACETAAARADANGREVDGFAELAQRLGAGAVIASLWKVADESTAQLMSEFYKLKTENPKITKAEAMKQIQISMLKGNRRIKRTNEKRRSDLASSTAGDGEGFTPFARDESKPFAHPFYWSPFVLIGNWR